MCDVCGIRPAVVTVRRVVPGGQRVEHLCEIHAAEAEAGRSSFGGRSPLGSEASSTTSSAGSSTRSPGLSAGSGRGCPDRQSR